MRFVKENPALAAGIFLPVLLVIIFALAAIIPALTTAAPRYNLLFTTDCYSPIGFHQDYDIRVTPAGDHIIAEYRKENGHQPNGRTIAHLFLFDVHNDSVKEIPLVPANPVADGQWHEFPVSEVSKIDTGLTSPDGYEFRHNNGYGGGDFFFIFGPRYGSMQPAIANGSRVIAIPPYGDQYNAYQYNSYNVHFIGWVIPENGK